MLRSINSPKHRISKKRRDLIRIMGLVCVGGMMVVLSKIKGFYMIKRLYYKLINKVQGPVTAPPQEGRIIAELPQGGESISVEKAMNSRCTSDYDENPEKFHWGMFNRTKKLSDKQIESIVEYIKIPRFTNKRVEIQAKRNILTFVVDSRTSGIEKDWLMIESGMQQQAVGLVCAALGSGMVFRNLGKDGTNISDTDYATIKIKLDAMKPTYDGSFWSSSPPAGREPWLRGNMPDPVRDGNEPLISALERLKIENRSGRESTDESVSQLLWAARGRTPHFYKSRPWGMTIPTWAGEQNISRVYLIANCKLSEYINWESDRPTHSLLEVARVDKQIFDKFSRSYSPNDRFIVLGKNEDFQRSLWEVGYQLLNLLLQASVLNINYRVFLLDTSQKVILQDIGIKAPVAILAL